MGISHTDKSLSLLKETVLCLRTACQETSQVAEWPHLLNTSCASLRPEARAVTGYDFPPFHLFTDSHCLETISPVWAQFSLEPRLRHFFIFHIHFGCYLSWQYPQQSSDFSSQWWISPLLPDFVTIDRTNMSCSVNDMNNWLEFIFDWHPACYAKVRKLTLMWHCCLFWEHEPKIHMLPYQYGPNLWHIFLLPMTGNWGHPNIKIRRWFC
jgi:hypothetical protein